MTQPNLYSSEIEASLLGALLFAPEKIMRAREFMQDGRYFYFSKNTEIYRAMLQIDDAKTLIDAPVLIAQLQKNKTYEMTGGAIYIAELIEKTTTYSNIDYYCAEILNYYSRRELEKKLQHFKKEIYDFEKKPEIIVSEIISDAYSALPNQKTNLQINNSLNSSTLANLMQHWETVSVKNENPDKIKTGYKDFDDKFYGFSKGDIIFLASRPSMGKTSLCLNMINNISKKIPAGILTLEQSTKQIIERIISIRGRIKHSVFQNGYRMRENLNTIYETSENLLKSNICIEHRRGADRNYILNCVKKMIIDNKLGILFIDNLSEIKFQLDKYNLNKSDIIGEFIKDLRDIAGKFYIPIVILHHLKREIDARTYKKPLLSDLGDSGNTEKYADMVVFLYRDEQYFPGRMIDVEGFETSNIGIAELITPKHRNGPIGNMFLRFESEYMIFENY